MARRQWVYVAIFLVSLIACQLGSVASAQPTPSEPDHPTFRRASLELEPKLYRLYRIVDRLSRANKLPMPWRVQIVSQEKPNYWEGNTVPNLIPISAKILEELGQNQESLACVVAVEQARHQLGHVSAYRLAKSESEVNDESLLTPGELDHDLVFRGPQSLNALQLKAKANLVSILEKQNLEADQYAFRLMARAGYDYQGCQRVYEALLSQAVDANAKLNIGDRINALKRVQMNVGEFKQEGRINLTGIEPIPFSVTADRQSFRLSLPEGKLSKP